MFNVHVAIRVDDPDGMPPHGTGVLLNEGITVGVYGGDGSTAQSFAEDLGVALVEANKTVLDRALSAAAQIAKDAAAQGEQ